MQSYINSNAIEGDKVCIYKLYICAYILPAYTDYPNSCPRADCHMVFIYFFGYFRYFSFE